MDEHFTVWIKKACPFCVQTREELFEQKADHTNGPALLIGGYTDLKKYLDGKKND